MSVTPAFELGVWNAWILMTYVILYNMLPYLLSSSGAIDKNLVKKGSHPDINLTKSQKKLGNLITFCFFFLIGYSIFLPLELNTVWLNIGLIIYFSGVIMGSIAMYDFFTAHIDKPVTSGVYRISRHPIYLSVFLIFIGISVSCISWVFLIFTIAFIMLTRLLAISEEQLCLQKYGDAYRVYIHKTPRWIGFLK